jgi:hypothetical protein
VSHAATDQPSCGVFGLRVAPSSRRRARQEACCRSEVGRGLSPSARSRFPYASRVGGGDGRDPCARPRAHPRPAGRRAPGRCLAIRAGRRRPVPATRQGDHTPSAP